MTERANALERAGRPDGNAVFDAAYVATMFAQSASFAGRRSEPCEATPRL